MHESSTPGTVTDVNDDGDLDVGTDYFNLTTLIFTGYTITNAAGGTFAVFELSGEYFVAHDGASGASTIANTGTSNPYQDNARVYPLPLLPSVEVAAGAASVVEGNAAEFVITLSENAAAGGVALPFTLAHTGMVADTGVTSGMVTVAAGTSVFTYMAATVDDNTDEADGSIAFALGALPATHLAGSATAATVTVTDDEDPPVVSVADAQGAEGDEAVFIVRLAPASGAAAGNISDYTVTVDWAASAETGDTGTAGEDFAAAMGTLSFQPGDTEHRATVDLPMRDDDLNEDSFTFTLSNLSAEAVFAGGGATETAAGTVQELPGLAIAADDADGSVSEGEMAVFTVSMTRLPEDGAAVTVPVTVAATGNLFGAFPDSVTIAAGQLSAKLTVPLADDGRDEADGSVTVTISLPAGRESEFIFSGAMEAMLAVTDDDDAPSVSVLAAPTVREGDALMFPVELSGASEREITVIYTTEAGDERATATAGEDYDAASGTLTFAANETRHVMAVPTRRDTENDPDEVVVLTISEPANATLGTASAAGVISEGLSDDEIDALNEAILPHVIAAVAEETTGAVQDRVRAAFEGGGNAEALSIRGAAPGQFLEGLLPGEVSALVRHSRESGNPEGASPNRSPLEGLSTGSGLSAQQGRSPQLNGWGDWQLPKIGMTDFDFTAGLNGDGAAAMPMNIWGRGYYRDLSVDANPIEFDGDVTGFTLGADARLSDAFLAGVALNRAVADVDWNDGNFTGRHETTMTGVHPYFGWRLDGGLLMWGSVGYGQGELELTEERSDDFLYERDLSIGTVALGGYGPLPSAGPVDFGIVADFAYTRTDSDAAAAAVETGWLRAGAEADYNIAFSGGGAFGVKGELTLREDFGDAKTGTGVELGAQVDYRHPAGLRLDLKARALLGHRNDDEVEEWGISGGIAFSTSAGGQGFALSFRPEWGATATARDQLWNGAFAAPAARAQPALRYNLELQYGIPIFQGRELLNLRARSDLRREHLDSEIVLRYEKRF